MKFFMMLLAGISSIANGQGEIKLSHGIVSSYEVLGEDPQASLIEFVLDLNGTSIGFATLDKKLFMNCAEIFNSSKVLRTNAILKAINQSAANGDALLGCGRSVVNQADLMDLLFGQNKHFLQSGNCVVRYTNIQSLEATEKYILWCE